MDQTDIHFHILPGVDDGPPGLPAALELARLAAAEGTETVVATPHVRADYLTDVAELPELVHDLQHEIRRAGIDLIVECGAELGHDMVGRLSQTELDVVALGPPQARWLLVETPFDGLGGSFLGALDELHDRGFGVVLAHPERCAGLLERHRSTLDRELALGVQLQVNALSFHGAHGEAAQVRAHRLLAEGLVSLIASDAHSLIRPPALGAGALACERAGLSPAAAWHLVAGSPRRLLERGLTSPFGAPVAA
jgi:protein-tyrosine phosphatase